MLFIGDDWAEDHHDIEVEDEQGRRLARRRLPEGVAGIEALHALVADHLPDDAEANQVLVGIETDRGPWVQALIAAGYTVYAVNPLQAARYRDRHGVSGAKSDAGDAHVLAELVRLDRAHHRPVAGDSAIAEHVKVLARAHQSLVWSRQRQNNMLRSMLREFYPGALDAFAGELDGRDALAVLAIAPTPADGRRLSRARVETALRRAGRQRYVATRAAEIVAALRADQLPARDGVEGAYGASVRALVAVISELRHQTLALAGAVEAGFGRHPDVEIYLSQPGLGPVLGARVLAEFGDDPARYADAKARRNYAGTSPITRASGKSSAVLARHVRNRRLADALDQQAFAALQASPGARAYYDARRARGATHHQALRALGNRLVGVLHGCLRRLADLRFPEVPADLAQVGQQGPLSQPGEETAAGQGPQRALHRSRSRRQRFGVWRHHGAVHPGGLRPPGLEQRHLDLVEVLQADDGVAWTQRPAGRAEQPAVEHAFHVGRVELGSGEPTAVCQCRKPLSMQRLWSLALLGDAVHAHDPRHVPFLFSRRLPARGGRVRGYGPAEQTWIVAGPLPQACS